MIHGRDSIVRQAARSRWVEQRPVGFAGPSVDHGADYIGSGRGCSTRDGVERAHAHDRLSEHVRERLRNCDPYAQAGERPRTKRDHDPVQVTHRAARVGEHLSDVGHDPSKQGHFVVVMIFAQEFRVLREREAPMSPDESIASVSIAQ